MISQQLRSLLLALFLLCFAAVILFNELPQQNFQWAREAESRPNASLGTVRQAECSTADLEIPPIKRFDHSLFLHIGKAGGGSIKWRLKHEWGLVFPHMHPRPRMDRARDHLTDPIPVAIRDPIDRFNAAINWRLYILCDIDNEPRKVDKAHTTTATPKEKVAHQGSSIATPELYCQDDSPYEQELLFHKYQRDANLLAERLYDEQYGEEARDDLRHILHAGNPLVEWMDFDWKPEFVFPLVLERPLDLMKQCDDFAEWMFVRERFESPDNFAKRREYVRQKDCEQGTQPVPIVQHTAGKHSNLSPLAERNLARFYRDDYRLLEELIAACKTPECTQGIRTILERRAQVLTGVDETLTASHP